MSISKKCSILKDIRTTPCGFHFNENEIEKEKKRKNRERKVRGEEKR